MGNFLGRLFGKPAPAPPSNPATIDFDKNPVAVATLTDVAESPDGRAPASGDAAVAGEYERFRAEFCIRPGVTLMQAIAADPRSAELQTLLRWFHPTSAEPEPKAIIRLAVAMLDRGMNIWEQPGLTLFIHGRWSDGGGCSDASYECLEMLVYLLNKPIKILFQEREGAEEYRVTRLNPSA